MNQTTTDSQVLIIAKCTLKREYWYPLKRVSIFPACTSCSLSRNASIVKPFLGQSANAMDVDEVIWQM